MGSFRKTKRYSIAQPTDRMLPPEARSATLECQGSGAQRDRRVLEARDALEGAAPLGDLVGLERLHALGAERLDVERGEHRAERHRAAQQLVVELVAVVRGHIAHEAAGERVAR